MRPWEKGNVFRVQHPDSKPSEDLFGLTVHCFTENTISHSRRIYIFPPGVCGHSHARTTLN